MHLRTLMVALSVIAALLAVPAGAASASPAPGPGGSFVDDDGHPAEAHIEAAVAAGLLDGCDRLEPDRFCPTARASWSEVAEGLSKVLGRVPDLACTGAFCSALSVPASVVIGALSTRLAAIHSLRVDMPIDRATLAFVLASAADLDLPEVSERRSFRIAATGDILPHIPVMAQAARYGGDDGFDFGPMFASIEPIISAADLGLCHLETPLSADDADLSSYPVFSSPGAIAAAVANAGYEGCSTASNHSFDRRRTGVADTLGLLEEAGLGRAGTTDHEQEPAWWVYDVNGVRVAHLAYAYWLNGFRLPADQPWLVNLIDEERILADAAAVRARGAEFVVVSLHWGNEYQSTPTRGQRSTARTLLDSPDIDVIIGHHAHVVQAVEMINGKYVLYGLGNIISNQFFSLPTQDGVIAILDVVEGNDGFSVGGIRFIPTKVERGSFRVIPIPVELGSAPDSQTRWALEQSWNRTARALSSLDESIAGMVAPIR
ncbi:MAG TPA: CapA family protein [Acidimicrobiia bacterium]|nr:CapA family protein [Acidimicrobiia bacterium]